MSRRLVVPGVAAIALAWVSSALSSYPPPGAITMKPGETLTLARGHYQGNEFVWCVGNHDAFRGEVHGFLAPLSAPTFDMLIKKLIKGGEFPAGHNHGLALYLTVNPDRSLVFRCAVHP